jgi:Protein of unknown function (DUF3224)
MTTLNAHFTVNGWDERTIEGLEGGWIGAVEMRKEFTEGISGTSVGLFVSSGETEGQRSYFAAERITGTTDDGRSGSVTVHHGGLESSPQTWFGHVVPGSGTDDFADWSGTARIEHDDDGGPYFVFELA